VQDLTITLLQAKLAWQDPAANRARFDTLLRELTDPTDLIILPEMFTTGFTMDVRQQAESMAGPTVTWMAQLARDRNVALCGSLIVEDSGRFYNRCVWMKPDGEHHHYDKRHLFRMAGEHEHFSAGTDRLVVGLKGWRICPLVCYDLRFPVWSRGANAFDLLLYVANWPAARRRAWQALLPARAVENQCYVAGVNRIGTDGKDITYAGDSSVHDYLGTMVADLAAAPGHCTVKLSLDDLQRYREKFPAWRDADPFHLLQERL
jgi:predicted amidohydrolase